MIKEYIEYIKDNPQGYWFKALVRLGLGTCHMAGLVGHWGMACTSLAPWVYC